MNKLLKLSDAKLNSDEVDVLKFLNENSKPVLINCPANISVWGIDKLLEKMTEEAAKVDIYYDRNDLQERPDFVDNRKICGTQLIRGVRYLRLNKPDINYLINNKNGAVQEFEEIYVLNSEGKLDKKNYIKGPNYFDSKGVEPTRYDTKSDPQKNLT